MEKLGPPPEPRHNIDYFLRTLAELFFVLLPFIVLAIVFVYENSLSEIIYISEWSFAASILLGQALIKFVIRMMEISGKRRRKPNLDKVTAFISGFIVLLFVPSLETISKPFESI